MLQPKLLTDVISILNENQIDYMVTGSVVSSFQGEPRTTHDVDIVINITSKAIYALIEAFPPPKYYLMEKSIKEAVAHQSMFNLIDSEAGDKIDFWILTNEPFDISRFDRKYEENVFGFKMKICTPEDTILAKLRWAKVSGGSEKQFNDALRVYEVQYGILDLKYLEVWASRLQINDLWKQVRKEANPIEE
ncbi:MAG TPA: hypothetical protein VE978_07475 [Chitinophagales bacterium]|nr:hypothetical protein [Chitinophagales bacterium]